MIDTSREQGIRAITINPDLWADQPEMIGAYLAEMMKQRPAAIWMIVVGPAGSAERIMDQRAFMWGDAEPPVAASDLGAYLSKSDPTA